MGLNFAETHIAMIPNGVDPDSPPGTGWSVTVALSVTATENNFNSAAYVIVEEEANAAAGGSLAWKAGEPHNAQPPKPLVHAVDLAGTVGNYPWGGAGFVQWDIPYVIIQTSDGATVDHGTVTQRISIDANGSVTVSKGNFEKEMGVLPPAKKDA